MISLMIFFSSLVKQQANMTAAPITRVSTISTTTTVTPDATKADASEQHIENRSNETDNVNTDYDCYRDDDRYTITTTSNGNGVSISAMR